MTYPDLLVLRHGETEWNKAGRLQGHLDSPLTALGEAQARRQGEILAAFGADENWRWLTSPQGRARRTAEIAKGGGGARSGMDERLAEIGIGPWAGRMRDDLMSAHPELFKDNPLHWYDRVEGGEGVRALAARLSSLLEELDQPTVLVTHGITSRVLRCLATGQPWDAYVDVGGGQGVVYHIRNGESEMYDRPAR